MAAPDSEKRSAQPPRRGVRKGPVPVIPAVSADLAPGEPDHAVLLELTRLAEIDPKRAVAETSRLTHGTYGPRGVTRTSAFASRSLIPEVFEAAQSLEDPSDRIPVLTAVAARMPVSQRARLIPALLSSVAEIEDDGIRAASLQQVARLLPTEMLPQAVSIARRIPPREERAEALLAIARQSPEPERDSLLAEAEAVFEGILDEQRSPGANVFVTPDTVRAHWSLAEIADARGDVKAARELWERAVTAAREEYGPGDRKVIAAMTKLGLAAHRAGDTNAAQAALEDAYERGREALGRDAVETVEARDALAEILRDLGEDERAAALGAAVLREEVRLPPVRRGFRGLRFSV